MAILPLLAAALLPGALAAPSPALALPDTGAALATTAQRPDTGAASAPIPAPAAAPALPLPTVAFFGEVRTRSELSHPVGAPRADAFTLLRARLGARAVVAEGVRLVMALQDGRVLGTESLPGAANALDLHEGYLEIARPWRGTQLALRAGRQEIALGNERLLGRVNWSNTGRSLDALRLSADGAPSPTTWSATGFAATLEERGATFGAAAPGAPPAPDHYVFGLHGARALPAIRGGAELTAIHDRGVHARGREIAGRTTVAARLRAGRLLGLGADLEGAVQTGTQHALATATTPAGPDETIRAWMLGARVGTPATGARLSAAAGLDLLSGDAAGDGRDGAFSTLYATNHPFYGLADVVGGDPAASLAGHGLADAYATATCVVTRALSLRADVHRLAPARGGGLPGGPLGWEADVVAPVRLAPGASVELGYGAFRPGTAGSALGLGPTGRVRGWGYLQLTAGF
jgi:hypothetical protein